MYRGRKINLIAEMDHLYLLMEIIVYCDDISLLRILFVLNCRFFWKQSRKADSIYGRVEGHTHVNSLDGFRQRASSLVTLVTFVVYCHAVLIGRER